MEGSVKTVTTIFVELNSNLSFISVMGLAPLFALKSRFNDLKSCMD